MKRDTSRYGTAGKPPKHSYYGEDVESLREAVIEAASKADEEQLKAALSALGGDGEDIDIKEDGEDGDREPSMLNRDGRPADKQELAEAHLAGIHGASSGVHLRGTLNKGERKMLEKHLESSPAKKKSIEATGSTCRQFAESFCGTRAELRAILAS
jgi:hypothetical protein